MKCISLCLVLVAVVVAQGPIDGVYNIQNGDCVVTVQIHLMNFVSIIGPCQGSNNGVGVLLGSYTIAPNAVGSTAGVLSVTYATNTGTGGPVRGTTYPFAWNFVDVAKNSLNITSLDSSFPVGFIYTRVTTASPLDGTWAGSDANGYQVIEMERGSYLSYNDQPQATMGSFTTNGNDLYVFYSLGADGFKGTNATGTYSIASNELSLTVKVAAADNAVISLGPYAKIPANPDFEGCWAGYTALNPNSNQYCLTTVEFKANLWRGYQTRCDASVNGQFGAFLGKFEVLTSTTLNLTYYFTDFDTPSPPDLLGPNKQLTFDYIFANGGSSLTLTRPGTAVVLTKVTTVPSNAVVEVKLEGNVADFTPTQQDTFAQELATLMGIDPRLIVIVSVRSGSIIVTVAIQDDTRTGVSSASAAQMLQGATTIGGRNVIGVTNVTPGSGSAGLGSFYSAVLFMGMIMLLLVHLA